MKRSILIALILILPLYACAKKGSGGESGGKDSSTVGSYPDTTDGMKSLIEAIYNAAKANDKDKLAVYIRSLKLPDRDAWFKKVFGEALGGQLSIEYRDQLYEFDDQNTTLFKDLVSSSRSKVIAFKFDKPGDPRATGLQDAALKVMKIPTPLYSVRAVKPGEDRGTQIWSFVYVDGGFRFIGELQGIKK